MLGKTLRRRAGRLMCLAILTLLTAAAPATAAITAIPSNYEVVVDQQGVNDVNSAQNDLTIFGRDDADASTYRLLWSWDATSVWTGTGQTGNACALFDSDGDGNVNFVVCVEIQNQNANPSVVVQTVGSPYAFDCNDSKNDRCGTPTPKVIPAGAVVAGAVDDLGGAPQPSPPANLITPTDPFPNADPDQDWPNDSTVAVDVLKSFLPTVDAELINVCSYPSAGNGGNNNPFDCIIRPGDGLLVIEKVAPQGTTGTFDFTIEPGTIQRSIQGSGSASPLGMLPTTTASVTETVPADWSLTAAACALGDGTATGTKSGDAVTGITIQSGQTTTCTFTNAPSPPDISVVKDNDADGDAAYSDTELVPAAATYPLVVTYRAQISNDGSTAVDITSITDDKVSAPLRSADGSDTDCADVIGTSLAAGATVTCYFDATFNSAPGAQVVNTVSVGAQNNAGSDSANDTSTVNFPGDVSVTKTADDATVSAGDPIGFVITASNAGPGAASDVTVTDTLPSQSGLSWSIDAANSDAGCSISTGVLTCNWGSLASGANKSVHITSSTTKDSCAQIDNTANVSSSDSGSDQASDSATVNCGDIALTKTADDATVSAGDSIGFVITATNNGAGEARDVTVTDTLPIQTGVSWSIDAANSDAGCSISSGVLTCSWGTLASGASKSVHITSSTTKDSCAQIDNSASVSTSNDGSAQDSDSVTVNCGDIGLTKTADDSTVSAGDSIGFVIAATNNGAGEARDVTVTDTLPIRAGVSWSIDAANSDAGCSISSGVLTCSWGTLASGASQSVHITSSTTKDSCAQIDNSASVSTSNDGSAQDSDSVTVNCGDIGLTKTADAAVVNAGDVIGFVISATNDGDGEARDVTVTDNLPVAGGLSWSIDAANSDAGCSISGGVLTCNWGTLATGASKSVHVISPTTAASCATLDNTASVSTSNDGSAQDSDSVVVDCPALQVTKEGPVTVYHGDSATFTFLVTNAGSVILSNPTVSDDRCSPVTGPTEKRDGDADGEFEPGETWVYTCTTQVPAHADGENPIVNTVTAEAIDRQEQTLTATDTHAMTVLHPAIAIDKTGPAGANAGDRVEFTLDVTNPGDVAIVGDSVRVTDSRCDAPPEELGRTRAGAPDPTPNTLDPGDTWVYRCFVQTTSADATIENVASVEGRDLNGRPVSADDPHTVSLIAVLPVAIESGAARMSGPSKCRNRSFVARITGKRIKKVVWRIDGKLVKRFRSKSGEATKAKLRVRPKRYGRGVHRLKARVKYNPASQTAAKTMRMTFRLCAKKAIAPRFTG